MGPMEDDLICHVLWLLTDVFFLLKDTVVLTAISIKKIRYSFKAPIANP